MLGACIWAPVLQRFKDMLNFSRRIHSLSTVYKINHIEYLQDECFSCMEKSD